MVQLVIACHPSFLFGTIQSGVAGNLPPHVPPFCLLFHRYGQEMATNWCEHVYGQKGVTGSLGRSLLQLLDIYSLCLGAVDCVWSQAACVPPTIFEHVLGLFQCLLGLFLV